MVAYKLNSASDGFGWINFQHLKNDSLHTSLNLFSLKKKKQMNNDLLYFNETQY